MKATPHNRNVFPSGRNTLKFQTKKINITEMFISKTKNQRALIIFTIYRNTWCRKFQDNCDSLTFVSSKKKRIFLMVYLENCITFGSNQRLTIIQSSSIKKGNNFPLVVETSFYIRQKFETLLYHLLAMMDVNSRQMVDLSSSEMFSFCFVSFLSDNYPRNSK